MGFWKNRKTLAEKSNAKKDAYSFLPGILEVTEKPPHPLLRIVLYCLMLLIAFMVVWAYVSRIDIITDGQGKIVPTGDVKTIQSSEKGTVVSLNVDSGQIVKKGDALIVLESDYSQSDINELKENIKFYRLRISREQTFYKMFKSGIRKQIPLEKFDYTAPAGITDNLVIEQSRQLLWRQWQSSIAKFLTLEATLHSKQEQKGISLSRTHQLQETIKIIKERLDIYTKLYKKNAVAKIQYLEFRENYLNTYYELETEKKRDVELDAEVAEAISNLRSYESQMYYVTLEKIRKDKKDLYTARQELNKATIINDKNVIYSPIDGIVHQLQIHTLGAVITPAEVLMYIVPMNRKLEVEVYIKNQDIGYLRRGQIAEVKVNTFPFAEYGVLHGVVKKISGDAIEDEKYGLIYRLVISLRDNTLHKDGKDYKIVPGMAVIGEIKTGTRRVIDFFTEPITRGIDNSLRER